jgi:hypothetical protein
MLSESSMAMPTGSLNSALLPMPFDDPLVTPSVPPPANVVTAPPGVIVRILLFPESETMTLPFAKNATPWGLKKPALLPTPLVDPDVMPFAPPPASVVTTPTGVTTRMAWLDLSAT